MQDLVRRIRLGNLTLLGDLAFVNTWEFFTADPEHDLGNLITTGRYAGTLQAFRTGTKLRTRYKRLIDSAADIGTTTFWVGGFGRGIDTAKHFASSFWGLDWHDVAHLRIIPQDVDRAADTLTPSKTCAAYIRDIDHQGHGYGDVMLSKFLSTYTPAVVERLSGQDPGLNITNYDVYIMQEICGFEMLAKEHSPWCSIFTAEELEAFVYARDLLLYYRSGPGNPYATTMGYLWLNATTDLLMQGATAEPLFFSFAHDNDLMNLISALGLFEHDPPLPTTRMVHDRTWRASEITPMGGRIILERLGRADVNANQLINLNASDAEAQNEVYVRLNINDAIVALPSCSSGPGGSCPLQEFVEFVHRLGGEHGDFGRKCGLASDVATRISFLHQ